MTSPATGAPINAGLAEQLNDLLAQRNSTTIPSGFFAWWGDTVFPDGVGNVPALTQKQWQRYYARLQQAALSPGLLPPLQALQALTVDFRPDGPLPIAIASLQLSIVRPEFMQQVVEAAERDTALNPPPLSLEAVIRPATAFIVAGVMHDQWGQATPKFRRQVG